MIKMEIDNVRGKKMARVPVDPAYSHLLLQSSEYRCTAEMFPAVAMFMFRPGGGANSGDVIDSSDKKL